MLSLPGSLTLDEAVAELQRLQQALAAAPSGGETTIDASPLQHFDTAAVAVLLQCQRSAQQAGARLRLDGAPPKLVELARLYGVEGLIGLPAT